MNLRLTTMRKWLVVLFAITLALVFAFVPLASLLEFGAFSWHIKQPSFYEGLAEIAVLGFAAWVCAKLWRRSAWVGFAILCLLYARRHGVDFSIALVYLYLEGIYALGANLSAATRKLSSGAENEDPCVLTTAAAGLTTWLAVLWLHSFFHLAGLVDLRILAILVLGGAVLLNRTDPLYRRVIAYLSTASREAPVSFAVVAAAFFGFFAKAARTLDYDSMWYGLRPEQTLAPDGSMFDPTGLVNAVFYYPKLYESLLLPLAASQSTSTMFGIGVCAVFIAGLLARRIWALAQSGGLKPAATPWWPMLVPLCIPAFLSVALTTKGDAFAAACGMAAVVCACQSWTDKSRSWALLGLSFTGYACLARLSTAPYDAVLGLVLLVLLVKYVKHPEKSFHASLRIATFVVSLLVAALVLYRGLLLAGVPLISPTPLVELESNLGFSVHFPIGASPAGGLDRSRLPFWNTLLAYTMLPGRELFVTNFSWTGNTWLLAPVLALLLARRKARPRWPIILLFAVGLVGLVVLFTFKFKPEWGADGNYFILPFLCLTLAGAVCFPARGLPAALLGVAAAMAITIALLTGSWQAGTRSFDHNLKRDNRQLAHYIDHGLARSGLSGLAHFLVNTPEDTRIIGITQRKGLMVLPGWLLPQRFESVANIAWSRPQVLSSYDEFERFVRETCLNFVVLPQAGVDMEKHLVLVEKMEDYLATAADRQLAKIAYADDKVVAWDMQLNECSVE